MEIRPDIIEKYGNVVCAFASYYKYAFTFQGTAEDGAVVSLTVGGDSGGIYRFEVNAGDTMTLANDSEDLSVVDVSLDGKSIYSECDY
jgi:hypothetical protein